MASSNRKYKKLVNLKTKLVLEEDYKEILLLENEQKKTEEVTNFKNSLLRSLYKEHPEWMDKGEVFNAVFNSKMNEFDLDINFKLFEITNNAMKLVSKNPKVKEEQDKVISGKKEEFAKLRKEYEGSLEKEIKAQLVDQVNSKEREKALAEIDKKTEEFKAEIEKEFSIKKEKIEKEEDVRISKLKEQVKAFESANTIKSNYELEDGIVLSVKDLCMYFGGVHAVDGLSFKVKQGEIFGLIGPNGAGKTTAFNCITQFNKPTSGELLFRNKANEIVKLTDENVHDVILQGIIRTFQNVEVIKEVSVLDNLLIAGHRQYTVNLFTQALHLPELKKQEKIVRARAMKVINFMGLDKYMNMYANGLPYGILKKIEIARTLMSEPQLIILDEPAAGLNDTETVELTNLILKIKDEMNCSILLVEHDMGLVMGVCNTICAISFGKLLAIGTPSEIQKNADVRKAYLGESEDPIEEEAK